MTFTSQSRSHWLQQYGFAITLLLLVTLIASLGSPLADWLRYDRSAILNGEIWRLFSCHFVHLNWSHLGMNMAGFALIWILFGRLLSNLEWLALLVPSCLLVALGLLAFEPKLQGYVGFSGVLHSIIVAACLFDIAAKRKEGLYLLIAVGLKILYEQLFGPLPGSEATAGGKVIVDAHLYGVLVALPLTAVLINWRKRHSRTSTSQ